MIIACGKTTRLVTLSRISAAPASSLSFWTSSLSRNLPSRFDQPSGRVIAQVGASDALLDAMVFSRGRFAVSMPGSPALVLVLLILSVALIFWFRRLALDYA